MHTHQQSHFTQTRKQTLQLTISGGGLSLQCDNSLGSGGVKLRDLWNTYHVHQSITDRLIPSRQQYSANNKQRSNRGAKGKLILFHQGNAAGTGVNPYQLTDMKNQSS